MKYSVDRIENGIAVCEDGEQNIINIELSLLPDRVREGDIIETTEKGFAVRRSETDDRRKKLAEMQANLCKNKK